MFLRALYDFAQERRLLDGLPVEDRSIHFYLPINAEGDLVGPGAIPLFQKDARGKDKLGLNLPMPRFPGEKNGGKSSEVAPKNWTGGIVKNRPQKKERSACPKNDVSTVPS